ncbi:MAG: glycosyltransferase family 4 protein, partial [Gemmatimonadota bacterium]
FLSHRLPLAQAARDRGARVTVVAGDNGRSEEIESHGLSFIPLPLERTGTNPLRDLRSLGFLWKTYRRVEPDLVHHVTLKPIIYGSLAARLASVPNVVNAVSGMGYVFTEAREGFWLRRLVTFFLRIAVQDDDSVLIAQNGEDLAFFVERGWIPRERAVLIKGSGVDCDEFRYREQPSSPPVVIMLASRMLWDKGIGEFVEAARRIKESRGSDVRFVLVGPVDEENPAGVSEAELVTWEENDVLAWWGAVGAEDMPETLARAHVVCLPSYREGLPKVLLEAAATGRAIVTTDVPGCREVVEDGVSGLLVPARNGQQLAVALERLIRNPELREKMGRKGRERVVEEFSLDHVVDRTCALYENLLG